jgi:hypothetical protein
VINLAAHANLRTRTPSGVVRAGAVSALTSIILLNAVAGEARPPPPASTQADDMAPYGGEIRALKNAHGEQCCDVSDCRHVRAELRNDGHWWVLVSHDAFPDGTDQWQVVPDEAIVRPERRPMLPWALACWAWFPGLSRGVFQCFTPPTGT